MFPPSALTAVGKGFGILLALGLGILALALLYLAYMKPKSGGVPGNL